MSCVEACIDLDAAAALIQERIAGWSALGLSTQGITWCDYVSEWPRRITTDRFSVADPYSVGIAVTRDALEGSLILYRGGWADLLFWSGNAEDENIIDEVHGWDDPLSMEAFTSVLDRFDALIR